MVPGDSGEPDRPSGQVPRGKPLGHSLGWRLHATRYLYQSQWFDLRQDEISLPSGAPATFTYVEHPGFVTVVPLTAAGEIIMIKSYRYTVDDWAWELPAGGFGNKQGLSPADVAREELLEETGYRVDGELIPVARYYNGIGNTHTPAEIFLATDVVWQGTQTLDETEQIEVCPLPAREALALAQSGAVTDGSSALALLLCAPLIEARLGALKGIDPT